jgi:hypothetical protein
VAAHTGAAGGARAIAPVSHPFPLGAVGSPAARTTREGFACSICTTSAVLTVEPVSTADVVQSGHFCSETAAAAAGRRTCNARGMT